MYFLMDSYLLVVEEDELTIHLTSEVAVDLIEKRLGDSQYRQWTEHLDTCRECAAKFDEWRRFHALLRRPHLENAPKSAIESAEGLFRAQPKSTTVGGIRRMFASIIFDSFAEPALSGARGEPDARQVVLRAEEFDIHIRITVSEYNREVLGQIQPRGTRSFVSAAHLHLLKNGERISSTEVNDLGEFHFHSVPEGFLSIQVDLPHLTVVGALDVTERGQQ